MKYRNLSNYIERIDFTKTIIYLDSLYEKMLYSPVIIECYKAQIFKRMIYVIS